MREILKEVYQHCQDMQKIAETKNAGLIAFNGAVCLASLKLAIDGGFNNLISYYLMFVVVCSLISIFLNLSAISSQLKHKELELTNYKSNNLLFFGTVANYSAVDYLKKIKQDYNLSEEITQYHLDLANQIVINSQITVRKFKLFNSAFKWTIAGIATPLSVLIYLIFFNSNK